VCRLIAPDVLLGLAYTAEELEFIEEPAEHTPLPKKARESAADLLAPPQPEPTPEPEPAGDPMVTKAQLSKIGAQMRDLGITEKAHALGYIETALGLKIASRSELTRDEAKRLIDALEEDVAKLPAEAESDQLPVVGEEA